MQNVDLKIVNQAFNVCDGGKIKDVEGLLKIENWLTTAYSILAMVNKLL